MLWLTLLSIGGSIVAIIVDESIRELNLIRYSYHDNYYVWVISCLVAVAIAVALV